MMEKCVFGKAQSVVTGVVHRIAGKIIKKPVETNNESIGFITSDGYVAKVGDWVYHPHKLNRKFLDVLNHGHASFSVMKVRCFDKQYVPQRHRIISIDDNIITTNLMRFGVWQFEMYGEKANAELHGSVEIANGKFVRNGDKVWLWRNTRFYTTLICKIVVECSQCKIANVVVDTVIKCAYNGNSYSRKENHMNCFATKEEALAAQKCLTEHPFKRIGMMLGMDAAA